jgi:hypothetical protein
MSSQVAAASGNVPRNSARPPTRSGVLAPLPDAAVQRPGPTRTTAAKRVIVEPEVWDEPGTGFPTHHPYVRRFWTAAIGSGAVADLLRLAVAAQRGRSLLLPTSTAFLAGEGLVAWRHGRLLACVTVPPVPNRHVARMPTALRREHRRALFDLPSATGA